MKRKLVLVGLLFLTMLFIGCNFGKTKEHNVRYEENGGSLVEDYLAQDGEVIKLPSISKEGYTFLGWYLDSTFTKKADNEKVNADITLYAKWEIKTYTVTIDGEKKTVEYGKTIDLTSPEKQGYNFLGWYLDSEYKEKWNNEKVTKDITLYPKYEIKKYRVVLDGKTIEAEYGATLEEYIPEKVGYTFIGWYKDTLLTNKWEGKVESNLTLYSKYEKNKYVIKFSGTDLSDIEVEYKGKIEEPKYTKEGYSLDGWYIDSAFSTKWNFGKDKVESDITLYPKYIARKYSVTFEEGQTIEVEYDSLVEKPTEPSKTGYSFIGWYKDSNLTQKWDFSSDKVKGVTKIYIKWEINKYLVTFNEYEKLNVKVEYNSLITKPTNPTKSGYSFIGWYLDSTLKTSINFSTYKVSSDITLYAKWTKNSTGGGSSSGSYTPTPTPVTKYTVTYNTNGGSSISSEAIESGSKLTLKTPTRDGYKFIGWYSDESLTTEWNFDTNTVTSNTTLYAKWEVKKYTVKFNDTDLKDIEASYNSLVTKPTEPKKQGYTFGGWYKDSKFTNLWDFATDKVENSTTIYAKWIEGSSELKYTLSSDNKSYSVTGYSGNDSLIIIPTIYNNLPVTVIGENAFSNCAFITNITIPNSIKVISSNVFNNSLDKVYYNGTIVDWSNISFSDSKLMSLINNFYIKDQEDVYSPYTGNFVKDNNGYSFENGKRVDIVSSEIDYNGNTYYVINNEVQINVYIKIENNIYYYGDSGVKSSESITNKEITDNNGNTYYVINNEVQINAYIKIENNIYYYGNSGVKSSESITNKEITDNNGNTYYVINNEVQINVYIKIENNIYYYGDSGVKSSDAISNKKVTDNNGNTYYVINNKIQINIYVVIENNIYYFDSDGVVLANGTHDGYNFGSDGSLVGSNITIEVNDTLYEVNDGNATPHIVCSDNNKDHLCDVCDKMLSKCVKDDEEASWIDEVSATCTTSGVKGHYHCSICEKDFDKDKNEITDLTIKALGHEFVFDSQTEATCTKDGLIIYKCKHDGCNKTKQEVLLSFGHDYKDGICLNCGGKEESHTHSYTETIVEPTCTNMGYTLHTCSCGHTYKDNLIDQKGHTWDDGVVTLDATCTTNGVKTHTCTKCSETYTSVILAGHKYSETVITKATCTTDGKIEKQCTLCSDKVIVVIKAHHEYEDVEVTKEATCTEAGTKIVKCKHCNDEKEEEIPALGHIYKDGVCQVCHIKFIEDITEVNDHLEYGMYFKIDDIISNYGPDYINEYGVLLDYNTDATLYKVAVFLTQEGTMWRRCIAVVGKDIKYATYVPYLSYNDDIKYTGLNSSWINTFSLKENSDGIWCYNNYVTIGVNLEDNKGNLLLNLYNIAQAGTKTKVFDDLDEMIEWLKEDDCEHVLGDWIDEVAATCTENGTKGHYYCSKCGKYFDIDMKVISDLTIKASHTYGDWIEEVNATCKENGRKGHYHCSKCGEDFDANKNVLNDLTIKINHNYENNICTKCGTKIIYFGKYPQSEVTDSSLISTLSTKSGTLPTEDDSYSWTSYGYYISGSVKNFMWYIDIEENGEKYRGVYFTSYRLHSNMKDHGYLVSTIYWFKYEPIKWQILEESNGKAFLLADIALDSQEYYISDSNRTIDGNTIYANNYEYSTIRSWLNKTFYNTAFSELEKEIILTTTVDNSVSSTASSTNKYVCNDTNDKVFLLSYKEATTYLTTADLRIRQSTDYAKSQGCYTFTSNSCLGNTCWWLRTPDNVFSDSSDNAFYVDAGGNTACNNWVTDNNDGIVPALWIELECEHSFGAWIKEIEATCTVDGEKGHYYCSKCDKYFDANKKELSDLTIEALGHSYGEWIEEVNATCTEDGVKGHYHCDICGKDFDKDKKEITDLTIKALEHNYVDGVCTRCDDGKKQATYVRDENTIYFGTYPQTKVSDSTLISTLSTKAGTLPTSSNNYNWISYGYYIFENVENFMWYIDIEESGEKYRGVYFTSYRPRFTTYSSSAGDSYQDDNGYLTSTVYWFKYEPIKWQVLEENNGKAFLLADIALDSQEYYISRSSRTIEENTIYANNYEYSTIRKWLNDTFYNTAFSELEREIILTTLVDNSVSSTGYSTNNYICNDTNDKVFLLSYKEATTYFATNALRIKQSTDYAKSQGCWQTTDSSSLGNSCWWLRSPNNYLSNLARNLSNYGGVDYSTNVYNASDGVVPALWITL